MDKIVCCKCGNMANGRVCYAGNDEQIVDNPFCFEDEKEVFHQTVRLIKKKFTGLKADHICLQKWGFSVVDYPVIPKDLNEMIVKGIPVKAFTDV